ncbi:uncharacterized protein [Bemisia tabaci]|uniref:uncharacterized protein isoform X2 n=1 Tax=Bemisia tabaci TaxID=7038 RepID=UPI003B2828F8
MSNNSDCEVFTTPFKMLRFLFGIYLIPQGFSGKCGDSIGSSDFQNVRREKTFVDKTLWLKDFWDDPVRQHYITAPTRFGKTTLLSMMQHFFDKNQGGHGDSQKSHFYGTKIFEQESDFFHAHFREHVVLVLDFGLLREANNLASTQRILCEIYGKARYDTDPDNRGKTADEKKDSIAKFTAECKVNYTEYLVNLPTDLKQLNSKANGTQMIVLVDDVDTIISSLLKVDARKDVIDIILMIVGGFLNRVLGNHKFIGIKKSLLLGSMYLPGTLTPDNEVWRPFCSSEKFSKYLGLTHQEVEDLLVKFSEPLDRMSDLEEFYGGYNVKNSTLQIFNTGSIVSYLGSRRFDHYWLSHIDPLQNDYARIISRPSMGSIIEQLIIGGRVHAPTGDQEGKVYFNTLKKMRDSPSLIDESSEKVAVKSFLWYLENAGYLARSYTSETLQVANGETAFALGQALVQNSSYYMNTHNLSEDVMREYVDAFMTLTVEDPEFSVFKLATKIHKIYASAGSNTEPGKRLNFGGLLYAWLRYSGHKNLTHILGREIAYLKDVPKQSNSIWSRRDVFWGTPLTYGMPELAVVRDDMVGILANFKMHNISTFALKELYEKRYTRNFPKKLEAYGLRGKIYMGINIEKNFSVTITYYSSSHNEFDTVEYPLPQ